MKKSVITLFLAVVSGDPPMSPCAKVSTQDSENPFTHVRDCRGKSKQLLQKRLLRFVECTWVKGYTPDSIRVLLTGWYEVNNAGLCPVDSLEWTEDTEF